MTWVYFLRSMLPIDHLAEPEGRRLLTVTEAASVLRIGRSLAYELAREYLRTGGESGMPVLRLGRSCLRVPRWALQELAATGRVVRLCEQAGEGPFGGATVGR